MAWYFYSYSNDKFDAFRSDTSRSREILLEYFNYCAKSFFEIKNVELLVNHLVERGLVFDGYSGCDMESAIRNLIVGEEVMFEKFSPTEVFDIESETIEPIFTEVLPVYLKHPILKKMNTSGREVFILDHELLLSLQQAIISVLQHLETEGPDPNENVIQLLPNTFGLWTAFMATFFKNVVPQNKIEKARRELYETRINLLRNDFLIPIESTLSKHKYAILDWG
ncbi:MAG: hypothetical protein LBG58_04990 [Planctomycetaceae bacterium]|nr:hypothetical protein [Planctomycetaceae bacterium]